MVGLDPVVRMDGRVVLDVAQLVFDGTDQRLRLIGRDLLGSGVRSEDAMEEPAGGNAVTAGRDEDVDHLPCWSTAR